MKRRAPGILVLAAVLQLAAGAACGESIFNLNLLGSPVSQGDIHGIALGGNYQLVNDSLAVLQANPAMLSLVRKVTFGTSQYVSSDLTRGATGTERNVSTKFTAFTFAFPFLNRFAVGLGYRGRYDPDGSFTLPMLSSDGQPYNQTYTRTGGLYSYPLTVATSITPYLNVGGYFSLENGSLEGRWDVVFADPAQQRAVNIDRRTFKGHGWGLGAVVRPLPALVVGVSYDGRVDYDTDVKLRFSNRSANADYSERVALPARWTAAASWRVHAMAIHAGGSFCDFTKFEGLGFPAENLEREESAALGLEYLDGFPLFGRHWPVRLSVSWEQLPYDYPAGEPIRRIVAGLGTGLHFRDGKGRIDFAIQTGKVGSKGRNGLETQILRLYVGVSGAEIWQHKRAAPN